MTKIKNFSPENSQEEQEFADIQLDIASPRPPPVDTEETQRRLQLLELERQKQLELDREIEY